VWDLQYQPSGRLSVQIATPAKVRVNVLDGRTEKILAERPRVIVGGWATPKLRVPEQGQFLSLRRPSRQIVEEGIRDGLRSLGVQISDESPVVYQVDIRKVFTQLPLNSTDHRQIAAEVAFEVSIRKDGRTITSRQVSETQSKRISGSIFPSNPAIPQLLNGCLNQAIEKAIQDSQLVAAIERACGDRLADTSSPGGGPAKETPPRKPVPTGPVAQRWAVVVGVAKYKAAGERLEALRYADADAQAFRDFLISKAGGSFRPSRVKLLVNEEATSQNIRSALFTFLKGAIKEDLVVIFFSGHGAADPDRPDNLYLLTYDTNPDDIAATAFPMRDVRTALTTTIEAQRVVVLADACRSGGVAHEMTTKGVQVGATNESLNAYFAALARTGPGRVIFTSSERREVSQESPKWGGGHGVFTWTLLEGLKGAADADGNGMVTLGEILSYTDEKVRRETKSAQHPTVTGDQYDPALPMGVVNKLPTDGE